MAGLIGVIQSRGRAPGPRLLERCLRRMTRTGPTSDTFRHEASVLGWQGPEGTAHVDDDLAVLLDGWVAFPDQPDLDAGGRSWSAATVASAWRRWGIDLVRHVDGEFVIAVLERPSGVLHLVRDATGARPLFWTRAQGRVAFSSELTPLLELPWVDRELAREHLAEYLAFRVVHAPRTLLRGVHQLQAGHRLRSSDDTVRVLRWDTPTYAAPGTVVPRAQDVVPEVAGAIERAVRRHLAAPGEIGVYLSGGTGSTSIVAAARAASRRLRTFTVAFAEEPFPESPFAGRVAQLLGMDHHVITVGSKDVADGFDAAIAAMGHPVGNVAAVLQAELARAASEHVDRVLTGDGTDQLFGGRMLDGPAAALRRAERFHGLPLPVRAPLGRILRAVGHEAAVARRPEGWALEEGIGGVHLFDPRQRRALLLDDSLVRPGVRREILRPFYDEVDTDPLNEVLHAFFQSSLVADTLPRVEGTAAAAGLEAGFPMLDTEVRRLAQVLPGGFKIHGIGRGDLPTRWLLRASLQGALPTALVNRPDRGMPRPLDDWLTGGGRLFMESRFARLRKDPLELFHTTALEALRRGLGRVPGATQRLWALLILDAWIRQVGAT